VSPWDSVGQQLRRPHGLIGRLTGVLMRLVNAAPNRLAVQALGIAPQDIVLELGFGPGHAIGLLAARATNGFVYGIDQSPVMVEQAQVRNRRTIEAGRVYLYEAAFDRLPFEDASVDKILAVNVIYFWQDSAAVLAEIRRVLRPGGKIAIYATQASSMRRWKFASPETHRLFTAHELSTLLEQGGFRPDQIKVLEIPIARGIDGLIATASMPTGSPKAAFE
jgi:ubiquinone/menaquinone biosynthesis C-methylase UbiE